MNGKQKAVTVDLREGMEAIAGFYAPAHHDKALARIGADIDALPDPFDGGCPADVTADEAHGGRGGTMGDAAAALPVTQADRFIARIIRHERAAGRVEPEVRP
jgi:hypothetical protein